MSKMKNSYKISLLLFMTLLVSACSKDSLTLAPETALGELNAFDTKERVVGQVNGLYATMKDGAYLGGRYYVYNDIREENFIPKSTNLVTNYATWNHTVLGSTNEVQNLWGQVYRSVNSINLFLTGLEENYSSGKLATIGVTDAEYNQYKGEALALRAICYFSMLQLYAQPYNKDNGASPGLPLRLLAEKTAANNDLARSTVAETYAQILSDLNAAEPLVLADNGSALLNVTRLHKNSIAAFKTRVYLHMNNFASVKSEAAKIVSATAPFTAPSGVAFKLNSTFAGIWASPYTTSESIFSMPFTSTNLPGTQNGLAHYHHPSSSESYYLNTEPGTAYAMLDAADARKVLFQSGTVSGATVYFVGKWQNFTVQADYAPVMRYAEVLLNYAEAIAKADGVTQQAVDLLNAVRIRSFPAGAYTLASFANATAFVDAILKERTMEFLGEGIRNMDIMRTYQTIPGKQSIPAVPTTSKSYIWPIPDSEMSTNKAMVGN
jgi:hypothetical protein